MTVEGEEKVKVLIGLSANYLRISPEQSHEYANQALQYSKDINYERGIATSNNVIGVGYSNQGEYMKALTYHERALEIFNKLKDTAAIGVTFNNIGINYRKLGNYNQAISSYQQAYDLARKSKDTIGSIRALNNIGVIYSDWKKYDLALEYYQKHLAAVKEIGDKSLVALTLNNIGNIYTELNKLDLALDNYLQSLELNRELGTKKGIMVTLRSIGRVYSEKGKYQEAIEYYEQSLKLSDELADKPNKAYVEVKLGDLYLKQKDYPRAYPLLQDALKIIREINETSFLKDVYEILARYYYETGNYSQAYDHYKLYTEVKDTLYNRESRKELTEMQTKYETEKKEHEIKTQQLKIEKQRARFYYLISSIALLVFIAYMLFTRYKLRQKHFRTELEKKNIEIEQRLLRTQMNPHFIFNSLNSISSFISANNSGSAQTFLSKFARLMRYILDNSRKSFVPVDDEVNTLQLYMELERLRFDDKFDFSIVVEEGIDHENTYIPPMLIQPFVENSIIHGLANKPSQGNIRIDMKTDGRVMSCVVEDDGVGREKAMEIKKLAGKTKHKSLGMQVTQERLDLLRDKSGLDVSVRIIDLMDEAGKPGGTRVEIRLPFETE
jgi:tetratricopeptide (TPR) repeat protein/anti-sigma regulatory factor (Ser/Thr protein kinase)